MSTDTLDTADTGLTMDLDAGADTTAPVYVGFWKRALSYIVNGLLLGIVTGPIIYSGLDLETMQVSSAGYIAQYVLPPLYFVVMWATKQTDVGKMIWSARIVDSETGGPVPGFRCFLRYIGTILSAIPFGLGFIWVGFDKRKQGWHDKIAGTVVVTD
jgi:uncharacterized RDD family membrane protein YckC